MARIVHRPRRHIPRHDMDLFGQAVWPQGQWWRSSLPPSLLCPEWRTTLFMYIFAKRKKTILLESSGCPLAFPTGSAFTSHFLSMLLTFEGILASLNKIFWHVHTTCCKLAIILVYMNMYIFIMCIYIKYNRYIHIQFTNDMKCRTLTSGIALSCSAANQGFSYWRRAEASSPKCLHLSPAQLLSWK